MFEKEIKYITDVSLNKLKKLGAFFTFEQIRSSELHPAITRYINAELDYLIFQDRKKLLSKSAFDYSDPEVEKYFGLIANQIKSKKKISFEDAKTLIVQAVSFTANYVVRPKWSLTKFVYNQDQLKSVDEIKYSLNYLYYYEFIKNVLLTLIEKKKSVNFSLVDFEVALNKIDKELLAANKEKVIDNALYSIADFFGTGNKESNQVSPNSVELYLKEKDLVDYLFRLRRALPVDAKYQYDVNEIRKILYTPGSPDNVSVLPSRDKIKEEAEEKVKVQGDLFEQNKDEILNPDIENEFTESKLNPDLDESERQEIILDEVEESFDMIDKSEEKIEVDDFEPDEKLQENEIVSDIQTDNVEEIAEDEILNELSSDDDLLEAFDSQLKALEEDSKLFLDEENKIEEELLKPDKDEEPDKIAEVPDEENDEIEIELKNYDDDILINEEDNSEETDENPDLSEDNSVDLDEEKDEVSFPEIDAEDESKSISVNFPFRDKDIFSFLTDKEIDRIVTNVFNDDREDFANTMEKVSECFTYNEATEILKGVFFSYRINPYSKDAVTLTNSVSNYFNQAG